MAQVRKNLVTADQLPAVRSDLRKAKALAWLLEHVDVVDPEGQPIDRAELEPSPVAGDGRPSEDSTSEESAD